MDLNKHGKDQVTVVVTKSGEKFTDRIYLVSSLMSLLNKIKATKKEIIGEALELTKYYLIAEEFFKESGQYEFEAEYISNTKEEDEVN